MTYRTKALSPTEIEEHLRRADELGVSLKEYASAYDVNLNTLANSKATLTRWRSHHEKAIFRRTDHQGDQTA